MEGKPQYMPWTKSEGDLQISERYEHFLGDVSDGEDIISPPEPGSVTPLASDSTGAVTSVGSDQDSNPQTNVSVQDYAQNRDKERKNAPVLYPHAPLQAPSGMNHSSLSLEGYFMPHPHRSPSRRTFGQAHASSNQSSCGSLQALSEHEGMELSQNVRRTLSTRSAQPQSTRRGRSISHSKAAPTSQQNPKRLSHSDHPVYPDQSFSSLQTPSLSSRPYPILRTRSSHPAQNALYNDIAKIPKYTPQTAGRRTADNTPMSSPGLFTPAAIRQVHSDVSRSNSPQLHHLQTPKETHTVAIDHDVYSGNKFINHYEVVAEIGRGEHGKVKLGRDIERDTTVAIKIVPRYSAKRRLGKLGAPEDRTKREVAILKRARHPNVVSLLEVIDDPNRNKVYLVLEFVDKGEIRWRKSGVKEILAINNLRFEQEKHGAQLGIEPTEKDHFTVRLAMMRHERLEHVRKQQQQHTKGEIPHWSLEYGGETDDEGDSHDPLHRSISRQITNSSIPSRANSQDDYLTMNMNDLSGSMYGAYMPEVYRVRKFSVAGSAVSHMSSEAAFEQDDEQHSYVPALTLEEAKRAFKDTLLGLEFLHFIGIIHRDIKPANLLVSSTGSVKISDFGVSYLGRSIMDDETNAGVSASEATALDDEKELARSVGTPAFWAPEVCYEDCSIFEDGKDPKITGALDLWALGITLYCMIYARLPFYMSDDMGLHEAVCRAEVVCPKTRLMPVDTTHTDSVPKMGSSTNSNKRLDYELKFEHVPEGLRDLIARLLVKDPAKRITIAEAKRHPWILEGVPENSDWLKIPDIEREGSKNIFNINEKEIDRAVVKRSLIERGLDRLSSTVGRAAATLLGRKDTRKRASSSVASAGSSSESLHSPTGSSTSTVIKTDGKTKDSRRASLKGDEVVQALRSTRDPSEHPLAQSQTASPEDKPSEDLSYFPAPKAVSTGATPEPFETERRPRAPDRAVSALSTADSVKTIRASQSNRTPRSEPPSGELHGVDASFRSRVGGLWEGTTKTFIRLSSRDRDRRSHGWDRSRSNSRPRSEAGGHNGRSGPSLALSNTYAAGAIQTPEALRAVDRSLADSAPRSSGSITGEPIRQSPFRAPMSSESDFEEAEQINNRRQVQEYQARALSISQAATDREIRPSSCPPSPDDIRRLLDLGSPSAEISLPEPLDCGISTAVSASTIASSMDGYGTSSAGQSVSDPSIGGISGASSPPEGFLSAEYKNIQLHEPGIHTADTEPEFMRTADTITIHGRPQASTATGKPLQQEHEYYEDGDDESSSDEEGIVMGGPRRVH